MATQGALALNTVVDDILDNAYPTYSPITSLEYLAVGGGGAGGAAAGGGGGAGGFSTGTIPITVAPFSYSGYFNGTSDYLTVPTNPALNFSTGDFTVEAWVNRATQGLDYFIISASGNGGFGFGFVDNGVNLGWVKAGVTWDYRPAHGMSLNTWNHVAVTRSGTSMRLFVNGTQIGTTQTNSSAYDLGVTSTNIGSQGANYYFNGNISNLRVLKGTALYTANFIPPTQSLTEITNTSLLTLNTSFNDSSTNNLVITKNGNPKISNRSPFESPVIVNVGVGGVGSGAAATLGGNGGNTLVNSHWSGYFNNSTSDVIKVDSNATAFAIGTGNFTVEGWFNSVDYSHWQHLFHLGGSGHYGIVLYRSTSNNIVVQVEGTTIITYDFTPILGAWYHFALVRTGTGSNQTTLYINGRSVATATSAGNISADNIFIGGINWGAGNNWSGYISNIRLLKGFALYTSNFIPPTSFLTAIPNTVLLTLQNSTFKDNSSFLNVVNKLGSASITNSTSPFEIKMIGGGGGGSNQNGTAPNGFASGGGDAGTGAAANRGSSGIYGQGTPGGTRISAGPLYGSGGGGGAGSAGGQGNATAGGNGGAGLYSTITGSNVAYAGGGGAQTYNSYYGSGYGGVGGGGNANIAVGGFGGMYSGGGGGGGGASDAGPAWGGYGGTGVVILRHPTAYDIVGRSANAIDVSYSSGYKIYTLRATDTVYFTAGINGYNNGNKNTGGREFVFQNAGFNYSVDGFGDTTFPDLTLIRGQLYNFNLTNVTSSHPLALRLSNGSTSVVPGTTGNNPSNGVYGDGTVPTSVMYQVPLDAPSSIVYQCVYHSGMIGTINIIDQPGYTPNVASVSCLVIGGGGGGGSTIAGGGGAGGFVTVEDYLIMRGNTVTVTVGAGGLSDNASGAANAFVGVNSTFGDIISYGGGGGGSWANNPGAAGASGGGGSGGDGGFGASSNNIAGQGSRGGQGGGPRIGGGGGGAGQYGFPGSTGEQKWGGNGGNGLISNITGTPTYYSGGGAGGVENSYTTHISTGGLGGGGNMGYSGIGESGIANTGGGGGAGSNPGGSNNFGGSGGSGVVIISYATKYGLATTTTGSPTITTVNGNYVYKWITSGSITY